MAGLLQKDHTAMNEYDKADEYDIERAKTLKGEWRDYVDFVKDEPAGVGVGVDLHEVVKATKAIEEEKESRGPLFYKRQIYLTGVSKDATEITLEELFSPIGKIKVDNRFLVPSINIFMNRNTHRPRGDALIEFDDEESAAKAVDELDGISQCGFTYFGALRAVLGALHLGCELKVRNMDKNTHTILMAQIYDRSKPWVCRKLECGETNNCARSTCHKCKAWRPAPDTGKIILVDDWLCSLNHEMECTNCHRARDTKTLETGSDVEGNQEEATKHHPQSRKRKQSD